MKSVLKLLKTELKEWNRERIASNRFYERGKRFPKSYKKNIEAINLRTQELKLAINVLEDYEENKIDFVDKFKHLKLTNNP